MIDRGIEVSGQQGQVGREISRIMPRLSYPRKIVISPGTELDSNVLGNLNMSKIERAYLILFE